MSGKKLRDVTEWMVQTKWPANFNNYSFESTSSGQHYDVIYVFSDSFHVYVRACVLCACVYGCGCMFWGETQADARKLPPSLASFFFEAGSLS